MKTNTIVTALYGLIVLGGGLMGFIKAQSVPSLIMGGFTGALLLVMAWGIWNACKYSYWFAFAISVFLGAFFGYRYWSTMAFMPAGLMAVISLVVALVLIMNRESKKLSVQ